MRKILLGALALVFIASAAWAASMNVQVREVDVKVQPNYLSGSVGKLGYGAKVETIEESGNWVRISNPSGWVPKSSITKHSVDISAEQKFSGRGASHDEVALAGKGFNPQVEAEYRRQHPDMAAAYSKVDWIENQTVPMSELKAFAAAGKLGQ
jgi:opacity protein-like surface antigen